MLIVRLLVFGVLMGSGLVALGTGQKGELKPAGTERIHDFKMSVCEMVYAPEKEAFDVKFYLFQDDLKQTLYGNQDVRSIDGEEARDYILKHFEMSANGLKQPLSYQSMREKDDQVLVQFRTAKIPLEGLSGVQVKNSLLTGTFREQINMVYLVLLGKPKQTLMLNAMRTEGELSF